MALSLGAVATKKEYRGKGYIRVLMEHIINKYNNIPMYLFANDSVVDFYPRFGFTRTYEKLPVYECDINNEIDTMIIGKQEETTLKLIGAFSLKRISFSELQKFLPFSGIKKIEFGFMPYWSDIEYTMQEYVTDPLFIRNVNCDLGDYKFPELSTT